MATTYQLNDYLNGFLNLMPTGRIWDKDPDSNMVKAITPLIPTYQRLSDRAVELIAEAFVPTTAELLNPWQLSLGLPDKCLSANAPTSVQRQQAVARFIGLGGLSVNHYLAYAAALGYSITITQYATFKAGSGKAGGLICSPGMAFSWLVTSPPSAVLYFKAGSGTAGQKLETILDNILQCEFDSIKPAGTTAYYTFATYTYTGLANIGGVLEVIDATGWPTSAAGLSTGAVWDAGGGAVYVIPGITPDPSAPPVFFGAITSAGLLAIGGGNLPITDPTNALQLWNNRGIVCVSLG
jgi:uncharacterized protein YmfQ (DUF2313 family)